MEGLTPSTVNLYEQYNLPFFYESLDDLVAPVEAPNPGDVSVGGLGDCWKKLWSLPWEEDQGAPLEIKHLEERFRKATRNKLAGTQEAFAKAPAALRKQLDFNDDIDLPLEDLIDVEFEWRLLKISKRAYGLIHIVDTWAPRHPVFAKSTIHKTVGPWTAYSKPRPQQGEHGWMSYNDFFSLQLTDLWPAVDKRIAEDFQLEVGSTLKQMMAQLTNTIHNDAITQGIASKVVEVRSKLMARDAAKVPPKLEKMLLDHGVPCSSDDLGDHAHGAHKAIEAHMYEDVYPNYVKEACTVTTQKYAKFARMQAKNDHFVLLENQILSAEDEKRYAGTDKFSVRNVKTKSIFFADSGHEVRRTEAAALFAENPALDKIYLAGIMPGETLTGHQSVHPTLYTLRYNEDGTFDYFLEETREGSYHHTQLPWMLRPGRVNVEYEGKCIEFTCQPILSCFAHTLVVLSRGANEGRMALAPFNQDVPHLTELPAVFIEKLPRRGRNGKPLVPSELLRDLRAFLPILKKSEDMPSLRAKLRTEFRVPKYAHIDNWTWEALAHVAYEMSVGGNAVVFTGALGMNAFETAYRRCVEFIYRHAKQNAADLALLALNQCINLIWPSNKVFSLCTSLSALGTKYVVNGSLRWVDFLPVLGIFCPPVLTCGALLVVCGVSALEAKRCAGQRKALALLELFDQEFELVHRPVSSVVLGTVDGHPDNLLSYKDTDVDTGDLPWSLRPTTMWCGCLLKEVCTNCTTRKVEVEEGMVALLASSAQAVLTDQSRAADADARADALTHSAAFDAAVANIVSKSVSNYTQTQKGKEIDPAERAGVSMLNTDASGQARDSSFQPKTVNDVRMVEAQRQKEQELCVAPVEVVDGKEQPRVLVNEAGPSGLAADPIEVVEEVGADDAGPVEVQVVDAGEAPIGPTPEELIQPVEVVPTPVVAPEPDKPVQLESAAPSFINPILAPSLATGALANVTSGGYGPVNAHFPVSSMRHHQFSAAWAVVITGDPAPIPYGGDKMCGVVAAATHIKIAPEKLWHCLCTRVSGAQMLHWKNVGCDEVFFHVVAVLFEQPFGIWGTKLADMSPGKCLLLGPKHRKCAAIRWTPDPAHYAALEERPQEPMAVGPSKSKGAPADAFARFIRDLENFTDSHGNKINGSFTGYLATAERCDRLGSDYHAGTAGTIKRLEGSSFARDSAKKLKLNAELLERKEIQVMLLAGFAGCAKSSPVQEFLNTRPREGESGFWTIGLPRVPLRADWKSKVPNAKAFLINTFEMLFVRQARLVIIDEHSLLLPGFLDFVALNTIATHFIIMGDETQGQAHNPNAESTTNDLLSDMAYISSKVRGRYILGTHRSPQCVARLFNVLSSNPEEGSFHFTSSRIPNIPLVVASDLTKRHFDNTGQQAYTFSGIQGQTHDHVQIYCDETSLTLTSLNDFCQAITRATRKISFITAPTVNAKHMSDHRILAAIRNSEILPWEMLFASTLSKYDIQRFDPTEVAEIRRKRIERAAKQSLTKAAADPSKAQTTAALTAGGLVTVSKYGLYNWVHDRLLFPEDSDEIEVKNWEDDWAAEERRRRRAYWHAQAMNFGRGAAWFFIWWLARKLLTSGGAKVPTRTEPRDKAKPQMKAWMLGENEYVSDEAHSWGMAIPDLAGARTHIPRVSLDVILAEIIPNYLERCEREIINERGMSNCFPDDVGFMDILAMFPRQKQTDEVFVLETIKKRLESREHTENEADYEARGVLGYILYDETRQALGLPDEDEWDEAVFHKCLLSFENSRTDKAEALLWNAEERSDPDEPTNRVRHWIKGQVKKKREAFYLAKAKAGQTLATCHEAIIQLMSPHFRYLIERIKFYCRSNVLIYHGCDLNQFEDWVKREWRQDRESDSEATLNDMANFDMTQGGESVAMEVGWLRWAHVPERDIECYVWWKTHIKSSRVGSKKTSRDTGEPGTFVGNTLYSIGNTVLKYGKACFEDTAFCFGGDDMAADRVLFETPMWTQHWSHYIHTVSKTSYAAEADFCGYILTRQGIMRDPFIMLMKTVYTLATGDLMLVLPSYSMELSFTYAKGDSIYGLLSFDALLCLGCFLDLVHAKAPLTAARFFSYEANLVDVAKAAVARILSAKSLRGKRSELAAWQNIVTRGYATIEISESPTSRQGQCLIPLLHSDLYVMSSQLRSPASTGPSAGGNTAAPEPTQPVAGSAGVLHSADAGSNAVAPHFAPSPYDSRLMGQAFNANVRKFTLSYDGLFSAGSNGGTAGKAYSATGTIDIASHATVARYIEFNYAAEVTALSISVTPILALRDYPLTYITALAPAGSSADSTGAMLDRPGSERRVCNPWAPGMLAAGLERIFSVGEFDVTPIIKPAPHFGGRPVILLRITWKYNTDVAKDHSIFFITVYCTIVRH